MEYVAVAVGYTHHTWEEMRVRVEPASLSVVLDIN